MVRMKQKAIAVMLCFTMIFSNVTTSFAANENSKATVSDASVWTTEDFIYTDYEKLLYGCDYTRQIVIKGRAIAGFSESGEEKLLSNTDLVLPAEDDSGETIVAVAESAFSKKGLTSVTFPTGMMADYDDTISNKITKRGNFVIAESAFAGNELTELRLPEGVIACLSYAFNGNKIETVKLPRTIWWIETMSFANNRLNTVEFPQSCDFQVEMHGMAFAKNFIKSVRLPDYTEVVNKDTFAWNTGKEPMTEDAKDAYKTYTVDGVSYESGVVYMYTDNDALAGKDRIHHTEKLTSSQKSYVQKLVVNDGTQATQNPDQTWTIDDFTVEGTVITGLSESGIIKRENYKDLVIPEYNADGEKITEIAAAKPGGYGLFATEEEGFDSVYFPSGLKTIGAYSFQSNGLSEITLPHRLETIGDVAFQTNNLTSVILPDTLTSLGMGAFATNPKLERINLSKSLTEISEAAFGCSTMTVYMTNLREISLHEGITKIGKRAFAGNNFAEIVIPSTVKEIDDYAFSTKNYLKIPCTVTLNEGLEVIGKYAFRNKVIEKITLPSTVTKIDELTFCKEYSDGSEGVVTKVYVPLQSQYEDKTNFPDSEYHKLYLTSSLNWTAEDFTYAQQTFTNEKEYTAWVVTGLSEEGKSKIADNKKLVIPSKDPEGNEVQGIGDGAFTDCGVESLTLSEEILYVGVEAFANNQLTKVKLSRSVIKIENKAFENNRISAVEFAETAKASFYVEERAFAGNEIQAVQLPSNTEKVDRYAFLKNTGMETIIEGTEEEKSGGLVYMYLDAEYEGTAIACKSGGTSVVQELILGRMDDQQKPWGVNDFTFDESGTTVTGLSELGKVKIKVNPKLILPDNGPTGEAITALGEGENMQGIFVYEDITTGKVYAPLSVELPDTLKVIGRSAFALNAGVQYEAEMTEIKLPDGLNEIGMTAFQNSKLTSIHIPDSVKVMGQGTFTGSGELTKVRLSKGVEDIPTAAFNAGAVTDMNLKEVVIPEGVKTIGTNAFAGTHIEKLTLPSTLTEIKSNAFWNHQLTTLEIPSGVTTIGEYAFRISQDGLESTLKELTLNEGLVTIEKGAFWGCAITEVDLPDTVVLSAVNGNDDGIFGGQNKPADKIVLVKVSDKAKEDAFNTTYANRYSHKVVFDKLVGTGWKSGDFTYNEGKASLTGWSESGYEKRKTLRNLVLPDQTPGGKDITSVADEAFKIPDDEIFITKFGVDSPNGMQTVDFPEHLTTIGKEAFAQNALTMVDLSGLVKIGESAFYGNDLIAVHLPDTVTEIGMGAFATNDITDLKLSERLTVIPQGAFSMNIRMEKVEIPETITEIGATAFAGARLTELTIPKNVTKIGEKAFHLHHLTELTIPGNVKEVGESAFEGTYKATTLSKLIIEEGVESIGKYAFKEALLETVHFPDSLKTVGEKPFLNNKGKDGTQVVEVTTNNPDHLAFSDDTYVIRYMGDGNMELFKEKVRLSYTSAAYDGNYKRPSVTIKGLTKDTDFTVSYSNNKYPGTATVTITGKGNYEGTITKTFTIKKPVIAAPKEVKVNLYGYDDLRGNWSAQTVKGTTVKYKVEYKKYGGKFVTLSKGTTKTTLTKANLSDGVRYCFKVTPYVIVNGKTYYGKAKTSSYVYTLKKLDQPEISVSGTKVKVKWNNINGETGYQISRTTSKNGTKIVKTVSGANARNTTVSAAKGTKYYYKVRAYKTVDGKKICGPWSSVKSYRR